LKFKSLVKRPAVARYRIGTLAARAGTAAPTIRYYEEIGLLRRADRQEGGQRRYGEEDVERLTLVRRCREFGFSIEDVRALLAVLDDPGRPCLDAAKLARMHLTAVRSKLLELRALERSLSRLVAGCEMASRDGRPAAECAVLGDLMASDPLFGSQV
jgi:DNA-binding transcriptional MerR regulator